MNVRKDQLWKIPIYCWVVTVLMRTSLGMNLLIQVAGRLGQDLGFLLYYVLVFIAFLLFGGLVVIRGMSRQEVFWSATIVVGYNLLILLLDGVLPATLSIFIYQYLGTTEWAWAIHYVSTIVLKLDWTVVGRILIDVSPYLFLIFRLRKAEEK